MYKDCTQQSRWTRFIFFTLPSLFVIGNGCQFSRYDDAELDCVDINQLNNLTSEVAFNVNKLKVERCMPGNYQIRTNMLARFSNLERVELDCGENTHWTIEAGAFHNVSSIENIQMTNSAIMSIPNKEFCHMNKLRYLNLRSNRIADVAHVGLGNSTGKGLGCEATSLEIIDLGDNLIQSLPDNNFLRLLSNLTRLSLNTNQLIEIGPEALVANNKLNSLVLQSNNLTHIAPRTFKNLTKLKELSLSYNCFTSLSSHTFHGLRKLLSLGLKHNRIHHLDADVFVELENLETLHLAHNSLATIPDGLFRSLEWLQFLFLNNNQLTDLGKHVFAGLTELSYLNLDDNPIFKVHSDTFDSVPNLIWLYFSNSSLTSVPRLPLKRLTETYLTNGSIASMNSTSLEQAGRLQILYLNNNSIEDIGDFAFRNLTQLTDLNLAFNHIRTMSNKSFESLQSLVTLRLEHNKINFAKNVQIHVDSDIIELNLFKPLKALVYLNLTHNALTYFRYGWWPEKVEWLNLSHNHITNLTSFGVSQTLSLKSIDLSHNEITQLCGSIDYKFLHGYRYDSAQCFPRSVERILLNNNVLTSIDERIFQANWNLRQVLLNNNQLRHLKLNTPNFNPDLGIVKLGLDQNPWLCDCNLKWLKQVVTGELPHLLYFVQDANKLQCERFYHKDKERYVPLVLADNNEDFMCSFTKNNSKYCLVWDTKPAKLEVCEHECPDGCTCYRAADWELINVDCTARNLTRIPGKLHPVTVSIFLDHNSIKVIEADDLDVEFMYLYEIYLNDNSLQTIKDGAFRRLHSVQRLFLQSNRLRYLAQDLFLNLTRLVMLDLSNNLLSKLSGNLFQPLEHLEEMLLNNNRLHSYPVWDFVTQVPRLEHIALDDNPWSCECDYVALFTNWMRGNAKKLKNAEEMYCMTDSHERLSFITFNETMCYGSVQVMSNWGEAPILATAFIILVTVVAVSMLVFVYRREMQILIYSRYGVRLFYEAEDGDDRDKQFDAFVSYSSLDEQFVVHEFLPGLEGIENPYTLCLHHRDFPIGAFINESIFTAVDKSRRTILILSDNFVRSEWCRFEFRTAHSQMLQDRRNRVIVIILDEVPNALDPEMRLYLRTKTYLCWKDRLFWEKLYFAMPERSLYGNVAGTVDEHIL